MFIHVRCTDGNVASEFNLTRASRLTSIENVLLLLNNRKILEIHSELTADPQLQYDRERICVQRFDIVLIIIINLYFLKTNSNQKVPKV